MIKEVLQKDHNLKMRFEKLVLIDLLFFVFPSPH